MYTKWFAKSVTMWGVFIMGLTAVLPAIGPMFGLTFAPADIAMLGKGGTDLLNGLGSIIGFVMAIYGRFNATVPLSVSK